jgi:hypothetical protein
MQELLERYPNGKDILALTNRQLDAVLLQIVTARASGNDLAAPKFLSLGELENIYGVGLSLAAPANLVTASFNEMKPSPPAVAISPISAASRSR